MLKIGIIASRQSLLTAGSKYIAALLVCHDKELRTDCRSAQILALKDMFEAMEHFMSMDDTKVMIAKVLDFFKVSAERKNTIISNKECTKDADDVEEEEEEDKDYEENVEEEEEYQTNLTYLLGAIIESHKDESLPHVPNNNHKYCSALLNWKCKCTKSGTIHC